MQEEVILIYCTSNMIMVCHSDVRYLRNPNARSRDRGHFFLANDNRNSQNNGVILTMAKIIKHKMSLAMEEELGSMYINTKEALHIH